MRLFFALALPAVLALSVGCGGATCPAQRITDPSQALRAQHAAGRPIRSLRADAKIDQRGKEGRIRGRILMFVERPDKVRFDAMTQFGPALILTSDGQTFSLSDFKDNRYMTGPACAKNLARIVGVALSSAEVASVLLGDAPLIGDAASLGSRAEPGTSTATQQGLTCGSDGLYALTRRAADGAHEELSFRVREADLQKPPAEQRLYLTAVTLWDQKGTRLYRVRYEDYRKVQQAELPHTVRIDDFVNDSDALLRLSDVAVDVKVPDGAFVQSARPGLKVEEVACDQLQ